MDYRRLMSKISDIKTNWKGGTDMESQAMEYGIKKFHENELIPLESTITHLESQQKHDLDKLAKAEKRIRELEAQLPGEDKL